MKKAILVITLMLFLCSPIFAEEAQKVKFSLSIGGMLTSISQGYDFDYGFDARDETGRWTESVPDIGSKFAIDIGVGVYPIPHLEVYASYNSFGGTALGDYSLTIPDLWWDDEVVSASKDGVENEFKATVISFGLAFHPAVSGRFKPYIGAGASNVNVKMDVLDSISVDDLFDLDEAIYAYWYSYYPYFHYDYFFDFIETLDITKVGYTEESETVWGFHAKAGIDIELARNICIFAEARYLSATVKFDRPEITVKSKLTLDYCYYYYENWYGYEYEYTDEFTETEADEETLEIDDEIEIKVGGVQGIIGIKFVF